VSNKVLALEGMVFMAMSGNIFSSEAVRRERLVNTHAMSPRFGLVAGAGSWIGIVMALAMLVICAGATPFARLPLPVIPGYMTAFATAMIVINGLLAIMLFSRGAIERRGDATALAAAYLFVAVIFLPLLASFPGGVIDGSMIGTPVSAVWLWSLWHAGFGLAIIRYAHVAGRREQRPASVPRAVIVVLAAVVAASAVATVLLPYLPRTFQDGHVLFGGAVGVVPLVILAIQAVACVQVVRLRTRQPEQLWVAVAMVAALSDVWLTYRGVDRYSLGWYLSKCGSLGTSIAVLVSLLHHINLLYSRAAAANEVLTGLARRDGLTGLVNRRGLDEAIVAEWRKSRRERQPLSVLMIDVDHFKRYNDRYGHPAGDECLRQIGAALQSVTRRAADCTARYGGEEFMLLLPATDAQGAMVMAARAREAVRGLGVVHAGSASGWITVSIGMASAVAEESDPAPLIAAADRALYCAKAGGRDRVSWPDGGIGITTAGLEAAAGVGSGVGRPGAGPGGAGMPA
jgi:diguanylate cyclase (GGDEF)-like protein